MAQPNVSDPTRWPRLNVEVVGDPARFLAGLEAAGAAVARFVEAWRRHDAAAAQIVAGFRRLEGWRG